MQSLTAFLQDVDAAPQWVQLWLLFMGVVLALSIPFAAKCAEARWALLVMALSAPAMITLHHMVGYVRLLGIVHVVLWTPFVIYLWGRRAQWRVRDSLSGKWIVLLFSTMIVSLVFDYADVVRWILGDRR